MQAIIHVALYVFYLLVFLWLIHRLKFFKTDELPVQPWQFFFLLKVIAGVSLTLLYTFYYTNAGRADIYRYFNDSRIIADVLFQNPKAWWHIMTGFGINEPETFSYLVHTQNFSHRADDFATNNTFIIRANVLLNYLSYQNIFINSLFFSFFSFCGMVALYKVLRSYVSASGLLLLVPLFLFPSLLFWSSGLLKETLFYAAFGFWCLAVLQLKNGNIDWKSILMVLLTSLVMFSVKAQVFFILCVSVYFFLAFEREKAVRYILLLIPFAVAGLIAFLKPSLFNAVCETIINKRNEFVSLALNENAGSLLHTEIVSADCGQLLSLLPAAFVDALLRPFIFSGGGLVQILFAVENTLFMAAVAYLLFHFKTPDKKALPLLAFCIVFALANLLVIGLTAPITGAIVHYRVVATPFILIALLCCAETNRTKTSAQV